MRLKQKHAKRGLMQRLLRSEGGNVALVSAALIVPMTLMLGSGD